MTEFDQAAWRLGQAQQEAADRRHAAKMAALDKKRSGGGGFSRSLKTFKKAAVARATRGQGSFASAGKTVSFLYKKHQGAAKGDPYAEAAKNSEFICSSMLGRNSAERKAEWLLDCARHPNVDRDRLIVHCSISRPEGHPLTNEEWSRYIDAFLEGIGAHGVNYIATLHPEKNQHAHLIYSRALPDGGVLSDSNDYWKGRAAALDAGRKLGLLVDGPANIDVERLAHTSTSDAQVNAGRRAQRRGTPAGHIDPRVIARVLDQASTPEQFAAGLKAVGILVKQAQKNGKTTGILFQNSGAEEWLAGSTISRQFSLQMVHAKIELNRKVLLKKEHYLLMQRKRQQQEQQELRQRQAAQRPIYDRPRGG